MANPFACKFFDSGCTYHEDYGWEPSDPPYCRQKNVRGLGIGDVQSIPCDGCTEFVDKTNPVIPF